MGHSKKMSRAWFQNLETIIDCINYSPVLHERQQDLHQNELGENPANYLTLMVK